MDTHHVIRSVRFNKLFWNLCVRTARIDLSSSLPSLAALQFQEAFEIWQRKVLCYRNSQIKTDTRGALEQF